MIPSRAPCPSIKHETPMACFHGPFVTIKPGRGPKTQFLVQKNLICHYSTYFDKALNGSFKKATDVSVELPTEDTRIVGKFYDWLYSGVFVDKAYWYGTLETPMNLVLQMSTLETAPDDYGAFRTIYGLYVFGDARGCPQLMDNAVEAAVRYLMESKRFYVDLLQYVRQNTPDNSALWRALVKMVVWFCPGISSLEMKEYVEHLPKEFLIDVMHEKATNRRPPRAINTCFWHQHS